MSARQSHATPPLPAYPQARLAAAFDRVMNPRDWKAPIRAVIHAAERPVVTEAVRWFTGGDAEFAPCDHSPDHLHVSAAGYRSGLGEGLEASRDAVHAGRLP